MENRLAGKCLVIMGGSSGIGWSAALAFLREGARLLVLGLDDGSFPEKAAELGESAILMAGDARIEGTAEEAIRRCAERWGHFHGLYHIAGGSGRSLGDGPLHACSLEGWNRTLDWNLTSLMLSNQAAIRYWTTHRLPGSLLNLSSVLAYSPSPQFFSTHAYAAAKSAVIGFSKSIAAYYATQQIRVNVLAPGLTLTPMAARAAQDPEIMEFIQYKQPLDGGRMGRPEDLDGIAVYLMSDESRFTTGQVIAVDGGWSVSEGRRVDS